MTDTGVSLIPRSSKTTKKKRTTFRPGVKKSNQRKNKTASSTTKASVAKSDSSLKVPAQLDLAQKTTAITDEARKPLSSRSNTEVSLPRGESREDQAAVEIAAAVVESAKPGSKESAPSITNRESSAASATTSTTSTRKRKANPLNNLIRIGSSLRRKTTKVNPASASIPAKDGNNYNKSGGDNQEPAKSTAIVPTSNSQNEEKKNHENILPLETKENFIAATIPKASTSFPALSAQDQATLNQMANERKSEGTSLLKTFCSRFKRTKGTKRRMKDKDGGATPNRIAKQNNTNTINNGSSIANADSSIEKSSAPSVQIIDGEIVLQESSVMFPARRTVQEVEEEFQDNVVEEDEQLNTVQASYTSFVTKGDHGKTRNKGLWSIKETELFYLALQQLGTDFGSMEALFFEDKRTRRQLKNKYRKELIKNPDLVQELALNPKYQIALDMTAFNLEVDPKRIEAHENEEPPAYEPTDEDGIVTTSSNTKVAQNGNGEFEGEVVEEDAEEERRVEASTLSMNEATRTTSSGENSLWPTTGGNQNEPEAGDGFDDEMGEFPREDGPNMDDFLHDDSYNDNYEQEEQNAMTKNSEPAATIKQDTSELVSLVPKKTSSKSRRPKIRPSARRKNK
mmetsp:Transcript_16938/g.34848  ORF Transcript_16938/g.34848 Transcript_16938/m.34848 type:complete len:627 (-) Transcript_16938:185-2065(-)